MERQNIQILSQLIEAMNDSVVKLEESFVRKDIEKYKKIKLSILDIHKKISEIIK